MTRTRPAAGTKPGKPREREALGRSRGGLSTKVHLLADAGCRPLAGVTSAGQRHDSVAFAPLMGRLRVARQSRGRPRTRPGRILADKAYSSRAIRAHLRRRGIRATIPEPADQVRNRLRRGSNGGLPPAFDPTAYKRRNTVERAFCRLRQHRAVAMTRGTSSTGAPSTSQRSESGSATSPNKIYGTRPSALGLGAVNPSA